MQLNLDEVPIVDYARELGGKPNNVMHRLKCTKKILKENLS